MTQLIGKPLVIQELTEFFTGPLRAALRESGVHYSYGDANIDADGYSDDFNDMVFDPRSMTALVEVIGRGAEETGRVVGYGRGRLIVLNAISAFTDKFGAPATFTTVLSDQPEPRVIVQTTAKIVR